jgi:hypothetical protein
MTKVIADAQLSEKLLGISETVQICDPAGRILGYFNPLTIDLSNCSPRQLSPYSDEEIAELRKDRIGRSLQHILQAFNGE